METGIFMVTNIYYLIVRVLQISTKFAGTSFHPKVTGAGQFRTRGACTL